jgi:hypothetical protein
MHDWMNNESVSGRRRIWYFSIREAMIAKNYITKAIYLLLFLGGKYSWLS